MALKVLLCERCGLVHSPETYDGLTCRNPGCGGKLVLVDIFFPEDGEQLPLPEDDEPTIAS